ncbi:hypothetical protein B0A48_17268 [Cryoendolithus antarcticus]|uniref:MHD domain-containing protein n=1 Tax=Cryoendolithus antarcticus TaxID=1507870 RepID=A0A1V8SEC7_9PEZI|nr:hypothetical protein B0A48_17268 [Cryoendolithus antarcticus]
MASIEALYIFDEHNTLILDHVYTSRPPPPSTVLPLYLAHPPPRPSLLYLPTANPQTILYSIQQDNLLFLSPSHSDVEPLLVLEFLHRVADALEEFLGSPLLASKITSNYDIVAQIVAEMADAGVVCQGEANVLRDVVETGPGVLDNLLGKVGLPGSSPALGKGPTNTGLLQRPQPSAPLSSAGSAVPWRRSNVRHTSNELYVDIVESLSVTLAPSGRPLAAFANGSIAFTSKVSGVPDLLLNLSTGGKGSGMGNRGDQLRSVMERVVFHPCVRLAKWKADGVISFIPPDGRFALCGYEADLLGSGDAMAMEAKKLDLPVSVEISTALGTAGREFEVRVSVPSTSSSARSAAAASLHSNLGVNRPGPFRSSSNAEAKGPSLEELTVRIPMPPTARNISDLRASKGEAHYSPGDSRVEWRINSKDAGTLGSVGAMLRCTVQGPPSEDDEGGANGFANPLSVTTYDYDDDAPTPVTSNGNNGGSQISGHSAEKSKGLMPTCATLSFSLKGWLASGLKVESLLVDTKKSRGVGAEVKPYKGVKYLTVSRDGIEMRC